MNKKIRIRKDTLAAVIRKAYELTPTKGTQRDLTQTMIDTLIAGAQLGEDKHILLDNVLGREVKLAILRDDTSYYILDRHEWDGHSGTQRRELHDFIQSFYERRNPTGLPAMFAALFRLRFA